MLRPITLLRVRTFPCDRCLFSHVSTGVRAMKAKLDTIDVLQHLSEHTLIKENQAPPCVPSTVPPQNTHREAAEALFKN